MQPWYWRSLPLAGRTGSAVFAALFRPDNPRAIATLLESPYPTPTERQHLARYSICAGAPRVIDGSPQLWTPPVGEILPFLQQLLEGARDSREQGVQGRQGRQGGQGDKGTRGQGDKRTRGQGESLFNFSLSPHHPISPSPYHPITPTPYTLPFTGGWLGWLGYDLAWEIERLPYLKQDSLPFPVAYWYEPENFAVLDHWEQILWLATSDPSQLDVLHNQVEQSPPAPPAPPASPAPPALFLTSQADYEAAVRRAKKYIQAGDIFQANLSLRFESYTAASSWTIYQALQQINPSPFASYWQTPWGSVISCSPERLVQLQSQHAETRPIAGTRRKGATPQQDRQLAQDLLTNAKERAEHIMLVDLQRNDLGRVCKWGSVAVNELLTIEQYSHVIHLVSNITGTISPDHNAIDLIRAMFPGGTITGCPKVRCMEIIEELEPVRRNLFYGSCGYLDWRGNLDLNILIRTLLYSRGAGGGGEVGSKGDNYEFLNVVWGQVGAGIVADSDPQREWHESLYKAQAQLAALKKALS